MDSRSLIDAIIADENTEAKEQLSGMLTARAIAAVQDMKPTVAASIFGTTRTEGEE